MARDADLDAKLSHGIDIDALIEELQELRDAHPGVKVAFRYPSGDHWRNDIARVVTGVTPGLANYSQYHCELGIAEDDLDTEDEDFEGVPTPEQEQKWEAARKERQQQLADKTATVIFLS